MSCRQERRGRPACRPVRRKADIVYRDRPRPNKRTILQICHSEGEARGNLLVLRSDSLIVPGDCHAPLGLAMTAVDGRWFIRFGWAGDQPGRRRHDAALHGGARIAHRRGRRPRRPCRSTNSPQGIGSRCCLPPTSSVSFPSRGSLLLPISHKNRPPSNGKRSADQFIAYLPGPAVSAPSPVRPSFWAKSWRILYLRTLPAAFMGKLSTNSM